MDYALLDVRKGVPGLRILETDRLALRLMSTDDAEFILQLVNEPSWLRYIGDRGVRTLEDARAYIVNGPVEMYARLGFGFYIIELKEGGIPIGICGLVKREYLDDVDLGYALLPQYWARGYAYEAASATLAYGLGELGMKRIVAITSPDNHRSAKLLEKLGLRYERMVALSDTEEQVRLFSIDVEHVD